MNDTHVKGAVMFGHSRFNCGVLVDPAEEYTFDPSDELKLAEFRNLIWSVGVESALCKGKLISNCRPTIEKMNAYAPSHSRLFKEVRTIDIDFALANPN